MHSIYTLLSTLPFFVAFVTADTSPHTFKLRDQFVGKSFLDGFIWETFNDPTHGRVNYVDQKVALKDNLTYASQDTLVLRADSKKIVPTHSRGRDSIRIKSKNAYTDSVVVLDVQHMPDGCGTWPAFWTLTASGKWPKGGEIDIIEGVNVNSQNVASLHTAPGCTMPADREGKSQTAVVKTTNCDANVDGNIGCGNELIGSGTYGNPLNAGGGAWYVMKRSSQEGMTLWHWRRSDDSVPTVVRNGGGDITPDASWGIPAVRFPTENCDFNEYFDAHQIIFDITFCGDWAGNTYQGSGCPGKCVDFVDNNPNAFKAAYWEINSLRVYTP